MNSNIEKIYPTYIDTTNPKFIMIDDKYASCLFVSNYNKEMEAGFLDRLLSSEIDFELSMFYEKKNSYDMISNLTKVISNTSADIKSSNSNQIDIDILNTNFENAKYIKKQLQIENDDLYYLNIYILVIAKDKETLESNMRRIESLAVASGLSIRRAIFRQEDAFNACLPVLQNPKELKDICKRNVLTSGIISTYPFLSNELCDDDGVLIGKNAINNSIVMVDRFDTEKYKNANMSIIGASGSGKSYFVKLMIARNRLLGIEQYIIDPDKEYAKLCQELGGTIIDFGKENIINVMEIRETILEEGENFLANKLNKLMVFFSIIFKEMSDEDKSLLEDKIIKCYKRKNITFENSSLYNGEQVGRLLSKMKFKDAKDMPILKDLYDVLNDDASTKKLAKLLKPYVSGTLKFMNNYTNINLKNKLVVADINSIEEKDLPMIMFIITEFYWDKIKENRARKKIVYLDEVWRLINKNSNTADFVFKMFKTIRKYGGAATAITQDINDFFSLNNGEYGKGILNNSSVKCVFQIEENDIKTLKDVMNLSEVETYKVLNAERGTCLMYAGRNHLMVKVIASEYEHKFISTDRKDL